VHLDVVTSLANIAQEWNNMGEYQRALQYFERALGEGKSLEIILLFT
jgi:hypothetical protein